MIMDWYKNLYEVFGASYPRLSIAVAAVVGAIVFGAGWWLIGKQYTKDRALPRVQAEAADSAPVQRTLTPNQSTQLQVALASAPLDSTMRKSGRMVRIQYYLSVPDGTSLRDELSLVFRRSGWEPWGGMNDDSRYEHGLWIYGPPTQAAIIQRAFASAGIPLQLDNKEHTEEQDRYSSVIVIGRPK